MDIDRATEPAAAGSVSHRPRVDRKLGHDPLRIEVATEEYLETGTRLEVAVGDTIILPFAELPQEGEGLFQTALRPANSSTARRKVAGSIAG